MNCGKTGELSVLGLTLLISNSLHLGKQFLLLIEAFVLQRTCNPSFLNLSKLFPAKDTVRERMGSRQLWDSVLQSTFLFRDLSILSI